MLKLLAVIVMLIDHTAAFVLYLYKPATQPILFIGSYELSFWWKVFVIPIIKRNMAEIY